MRMVTPFWAARNLSSDAPLSVRRQMESMLDDIAGPEILDQSEQTLSPVTEIQEQENKYLMFIDMPGLNREDIKIEVHENTLSIQAQRKRDKFTRSFQHSFYLPKTVDTDKIEARYENGVLKLQLAKIPVPEPKKIDIQVSEM